MPWFSGGSSHIVSHGTLCVPDRKRGQAMTEGYRLMTVFKAILQKPDDRVGRPMSIRTVIIVWFVLLMGSLYGAYSYYFGA